jgi:surface protein
MFHMEKSFNQNLSSWDVSNVRGVDYMFYGASSVWNVSSTHIVMMGMFCQAASFDQDTDLWDMSDSSKCHFCHHRQAKWRATQYW